MENILKQLKGPKGLSKNLIKWLIISSFVGAAGGGIGALFVLSVQWGNAIWKAHSWLTFCLPLGGVLIVFLYQLAHFEQIKGTNRIIENVRHKEELPYIVGPLIFISTCITHLLGGSAGREGAAIQIGGALGTVAGKIFRLDRKDMSLVVLSGVSGLFAALFGTPITATIFALEVISVGVFYYSGLIPCLVSALTAYGVSSLLPVQREAWAFASMPEIGPVSLFKVGILGVFCALLSVVFILSLDYTKEFFHRQFKNPYVRIIIGGVLLSLLSLVFSSGIYNGSGTQTIARALEGEANYWDFAVKILFTSITLGVGFKGGEIIPTFFIGATMGCLLGPLLGLPPGFCAAIALIATFCGGVNCPIASLFLSVELFGSEGLLFFAVAIAVSYLLSGYYSLYGSQTILYSKTKAEFINRKAH
ncbi:MAG: chloride channel protein [Anaerovoracaceae bacterium]